MKKIVLLAIITFALGACQSKRAMDREDSWSQAEVVENKKNKKSEQSKLTKKKNFKSSEKSFIVHVGSFKEKKNAYSLKKKLHAFPVELKEFSRGKVSLLSLQVRNVESLKKAKEFVWGIQKKYKENAIYITQNSKVVYQAKKPKYQKENKVAAAPKNEVKEYKKINKKKAEKKKRKIASVKPMQKKVKKEMKKKEKTRSSFDYEKRKKIEKLRSKLGL